MRSCGIKPLQAIRSLPLLDGPDRSANAPGAHVVPAEYAKNPGYIAGLAIG
jgi:hypothetical protein